LHQPRIQKRDRFSGRIGILPVQSSPVSNPTHREIGTFFPRRDSTSAGKGSEILIFFWKPSVIFSPSFTDIDPNHEWWPKPPRRSAVGFQPAAFCGSRTLHPRPLPPGGRQVRPWPHPAEPQSWMVTSSKPPPRSGIPTAVRLRSAVARLSAFTHATAHNSQPSDPTSAAHMVVVLPRVSPSNYGSRVGCDLSR